MYTYNTQKTSGKSDRNIQLNPELEPLRHTILSQHLALEPHIRELGQICLNFSKLIEKKKESSTKLLNNEGIPRSLRVNCELTTSPTYEEDPEFLTIKKELQDAVNTFKQTGLALMKRWSVSNIKLLPRDRCHNTLKTAIIILDGLNTYWENVLPPIRWPNHIINNILLLLIKIYFTTDLFPDANEVVDHFELPADDVILLASKTISKNNDDDHNIKLLHSIDLDFLTFQDKKQHTFILSKTCSKQWINNSLWQEKKITSFVRNSKLSTNTTGVSAMYPVESIHKTSTHTNSLHEL